MTYSNLKLSNLKIYQVNFSAYQPHEKLIFGYHVNPGTYRLFKGYPKVTTHHHQNDNNNGGNAALEDEVQHYQRYPCRSAFIGEDLRDYVDYCDNYYAVVTRSPFILRSNEEIRMFSIRSSLSVIGNFPLSITSARSSLLLFIFTLN